MPLTKATTAKTKTNILLMLLTKATIAKTKTNVPAYASNQSDDSQEPKTNIPAYASNQSDDSQKPKSKPVESNLEPNVRLMLLTKAMIAKKPRMDQYL